MSYLFCCGRAAHLFLIPGPPSLLCSDERDFLFWMQSCLEPFQKTKNKTHSQSAVFVASTRMTSNQKINFRIQKLNFGKLAHALNSSQLWWKCLWLSLLFNQYLHQSTKTKNSQALSFRRSVFPHGMKEIFSTFTCPICVDFKFAGRILGEIIRP